MQNLNKLILLLGLLFCTDNIFAQKTLKKGDITIHISAHNFADKGYAIDIYKTSGIIKIVYVVEDSVRLTQLRKDADYLRASNSFMEQIKGNKIISPNTSDSLRIIRERHIVYDRDSTTLNANIDTVYTNLLNRVANSTKEELLETEKKKSGVTSVVLDGVTVQYQIIDESTSKILGANTPNDKRYPLLYNLLKSTLDIGRKQKLKIVLTKGFLWY